VTDANPYSPPRAAVADVEEPDAPRPANVETACWILWAAVIFSALKFAIQALEFPALAWLSPTVVVGLIRLALAGLIMYWVTRMLRARRNWMRWLLTAYTVIVVALLGWLLYAYWPVSARLRGTNSLLALLEFLQIVIYVAAAMLLHIPSSRAWFTGVARA
jgi:hypothetical protein